MNKNEILDDFREKKQKNHAKKSFWQLCFAFACYGLIRYMEYLNLNSDSKIVFAAVLVLTIFGIVYPISGLYHGIKSIKNREPNSFYKFVGISLNLLLSVIIICSLIYFAYHIFITKEMGFYKRW